jgi:hypothetical protein
MIEFHLSVMKTVTDHQTTIIRFTFYIDIRYMYCFFPFFGSEQLRGDTNELGNDCEYQ